MSSVLQRLKSEHAQALTALRVAKRVYDRMVASKASEVALILQKDLLKTRFDAEAKAYKAYCKATLDKTYNTKR